MTCIFPPRYHPGQIQRSDDKPAFRIRLKHDAMNAVARLHYASLHAF
jgi:hypothetical protein